MSDIIKVPFPLAGSPREFTVRLRKLYAQFSEETVVADSWSEALNMANEMTSEEGQARHGICWGPDGSVCGVEVWSLTESPHDKES